MFSKQDLATIETVGKEGLSLKVAASQLKMTYGRFKDEFEDSEEAQIAYERGQSYLEIEAVTMVKLRMKDGDQKAFDFITDSVLNMNGKNRKNDMKQAGSKQGVVPSILLNPDQLLELDDDELKRRMLEKQITETVGKKPVVEEVEED